MRTLYWIFMLVATLVACIQLSAQQQYLPFSDFHIHIGYKHWNRPASAEGYFEILKTTRYDRATNTITFDPNTQKKYRNLVNKVSLPLVLQVSYKINTVSVGVFSHFSLTPVFKSDNLDDVRQVVAGISGALIL